MKQTAAAYSIDEAAKELGVSYKTLRLAVLRGDIPAVRIGRQHRIAAWFVNEMRDRPQTVSQEPPSDVGLTSTLKTTPE